MKDRRQRIIELFLCEQPHCLRWEYRKRQYKEDKAILAQLEKEGLIEQVSKDAKTVLFKYIVK